MNALLIANPAARLVETAVPIDSIVARLKEAGLDVQLRCTGRAGEARAFAAEAVAAGCPRVIAAGGDGTINEVIQSLAGTRTELAIVPLGTGNVIARYLGLDDRDPAFCCEVAATGLVRRIDLGVMGGRYFAATAGAGLDAQITQNLDPWWKQRAGKLAFLAEFFRTMMLQEPHHFRIHAGSRVIEGAMWGVLICNTNEYTWRIHPAPGVRDDDGLLDVVIIHRQGFLDFVDLAARMFFADDTAAGHPTATVVRAGRLRIEAEPPVPWQVEGDPLGVTPVEVTVVPRALSLVAAHPPPV